MKLSDTLIIAEAMPGPEALTDTLMTLLGVSDPGRCIGDSDGWPWATIHSCLGKGCPLLDLQPIMSVCLSLYLFIFRHRPSPTSLKLLYAGSLEGEEGSKYLC